MAATPLIQIERGRVYDECRLEFTTKQAAYRAMAADKSAKMRSARGRQGRVGEGGGRQGWE